MKFEVGMAWTLDPGSPISPQVHRFLRGRIIRTELKPGNRISESEIARGFSVSRQPVREAFIKLAGEGLVEILPQRGTLVSRIDYGAVLDARFLREAIESDIVRLLAQAPDPALLSELRTQIAAQREVADTGARDFIRMDELFHRTMAEGAGKAGAWRLLEGLKSQMDRVRFLSLGQVPVARLIEQHERIVDRIASGDPDAAEAAIRTHLREILTDLPRIQAAFPEFFDLPAGGMPAPETTHVQGGNPR